MLSQEQQKFISLVETGKNVFLTGEAGCGKTHVINHLLTLFPVAGDKIGVTAMTAFAAQHINGSTLHSFLGIGIADKPVLHYVDLAVKYGNFNRLKNLKMLIIDEISMMSQELLEFVMTFLEKIRNKPRGGEIQFIVSGDFAQLPPVRGTSCYNSAAWNSLNFQICTLTECKRQSDPVLLSILRDARNGKLTDENYSILLKRKGVEFGSVKPTRIYSLNQNVDVINTKEQNNLIKLNPKLEKKFYPGTINNKPAPEFNVCFVIGDQVVVTSNMSGLVNGTRGIVHETKQDSVMIKTISGEIYEINYVSRIQKFPKQITKFMPLKLAYAVTVHKTQGMTLDLVEIDLGETIFARGQAYTALSRAKNLESISIINLSKNCFSVGHD